jgi:tetratricopeptide (TPR) repeat protein
LAEQLRGEARDEAEIALRLDPALADAWGVKATAACRAEQWEDCLAWLLKASQLAPGEAQPKFQYALVLATLGYLDRAETLMRESMTKDPLNTLWRFGLARVLDTQGRHKEAQEQFKHSQGQAIYGRWFNAVWRGDFAQAQAVCAELDTSTPPRDYERVLKPSYVAVTEALQDPSKWPQARAAMDETERTTGLVNFLRAFDPATDPSKFIRDLRVVRQRAYSTWDLLLWSRELAFLRKAPNFQEELRSSGMLAYWQQHDFPSQCQATAEGADCQ